MTDVDLGSREAIQDPAGHFARAREHAGAVQWSRAQRAWVLLSHAEVEAGFRDTTTLSADRSAIFRRAAAKHSPEFGAVADLLSGWMNFRDDPAHGRLREPVRAAFTRRAIGTREEDVRAIVERTIADFSGDPVELWESFARPIPALVIAGLLGADPQERGRFQSWSDDLAAIVFSLAPGAVEEEPLVRATQEFVAFFTRLIEREHAAPSGNVLSALVHSEVGALSSIELVGACTLLLFGGHETTTHLIGNALGVLLERPELAERLRAEPALWDTAIDELLRVVGPARTMARKVAVTHVRGGHELAAGETVLLSIAAANHDASVFESPAALDLARRPNPHLGFGWGPHYCLGANLARLEARIALHSLLECFPQLRAAEPVPPLAGGVMGFERRALWAQLRR